MADIELDKVPNDGAPHIGYINDNKYSLEIKVPDPNNSNKTVTKRVHVLVDYDDIENAPDLTGYVTGPASSTDNAVARYDGTTGKVIQNSSATINDQGLLTAKLMRAGNTVYNIAKGKASGTPVETVLHTGIQWKSSTYMPVLHITGYAYGLQSPVEFKIGFYVYGDRIGWSGVTNMGAWKPDVFLFREDRDGTEYVAVGFKGSCYYLGLEASLQENTSSIPTAISLDPALWSFSFHTEEGAIPEGGGQPQANCCKVPYKTIQTNVLTANNADKLDGQHGSYYLDYNNLTNKPTIGNATLTLKASDGATATQKTFTANSTTDVTFEVKHADTSSVADLTASGRTYVTGLTFDKFGHVTGYTTGSETVSNTDTKVTQTVTSSSNTSKRPLILGMSYSDANPPVFTTQTDSVYASHNIYVAPKDGYLYASKLYSGGKEVITDLTGYVTGTGLTADTIMLGSGNSAVKTSSKKITTTLGSDDTTIPTSKAVKTYADSFYWANIKTSTTSSTNTAPTFGSVGISDASSATASMKAQMKYDNTDEAIKFIFI